MRPPARAAAAVVAAAVVLLATPAAAENPVLDAEGDADVASALAEATEVQGVCYGYELGVVDQDTGVYGGTFASSSLGAGARPSSDDPACRGGVLELRAQIVYTSSYSEAEDSAQWTVTGTVPGVSIADVERLGLSSGDLLDDGSSERTLLNAVLALPQLAAEQAGLPPVVLEPNTETLPPDAQATNSPGSDWLRENSALLGLCALLGLGGGAVFALSSRNVRSAVGAAGSGTARAGGRAAGPFLDL